MSGGSSGEDELCFLDISRELALLFSLHIEYCIYDYLMIYVANGHNYPWN